MRMLRELWRRIWPRRHWPRVTEDALDAYALDEQAIFRDMVVVAGTMRVPPDGREVTAPEKTEFYRTSSGRFKWRTRGPDGTVHRISVCSYTRKSSAKRGYERADMRKGSA